MQQCSIHNIIKNRYVLCWAFYFNTLLYLFVFFVWPSHTFQSSLFSWRNEFRYSCNHFIYLAEHSFGKKKTFLDIKVSDGIWSCYLRKSSGFKMKGTLERTLEAVSEKLCRTADWMDWVCCVPVNNKGIVYFHNGSYVWAETEVNNG